MRPPSLGTCGMSVSVLLVLCTAGLLATAASATQPVSQVLRASCDRYTDGIKKSVCLDMLAQLQQSLPANGAVRLHATGAGLASTPYRGNPEAHPHHQEPWYNHGPEDDTPYHSQHEGPHAEYEPYGDREQPSGTAPSAPLYPSFDTLFGIDVVPKNADATGRLTQDDFDRWDVAMLWSATLSAAPDNPQGLTTNSLSVSQYFKCEGPVTFDVVGTITTPTSMTVTCKMVPQAARVDVGAKFDWQEAQQPRSLITIPNPTEFGYAAILPDGSQSNYRAAVGSIQSPVAFSGSIVDLMMDALLGQPAEYAFTVSSNSFAVAPFRAPGAGKGAPANMTAPSLCNKLTGPAQKLCQKQDSRLNTPLQRKLAPAPPSAPNTAPSVKQVPRKPHPVAAAGGAGAGKAGGSQAQQQSAYGGGYGHSTDANPATPLVPASSSLLNIFLTAAGDVANATGHLSDRDFASTAIKLVRTALLSDREGAVTNNGLSVEQNFECASPVELYFPRPVNQPNTLHAGCRMEAVSAAITVGPKFPWSEAGLKKNEIVVKEPQWAGYTLNPAEGSGGNAKYSQGVVTDMESQLPFTGSITELVTDALLGRPSEFDFEVDLAALRFN